MLNFQNYWRCVLNEVRMYFELNPDDESGDSNQWIPSRHSIRSTTRPKACPSASAVPYRPRTHRFPFSFCLRGISFFRMGDWFSGGFLLKGRNWRNSNYCTTYLYLYSNISISLGHSFGLEVMYHFVLMWRRPKRNRSEASNLIQ